MEEEREAKTMFEDLIARGKNQPAGVDDAILRWNACVRTIERESLQPRRDEPELPLE